MPAILSPRRLVSAAAAAVLIAISLAGPAAAKTFTVTKRGSGRTVRVHKGDIVEIVLADNPSTGYSWHYLTRPNARELAQQGWKYIASPHKPGVVGSGGKLHITLKVVGTGTTNIRLAYRAPGRSKRTGASFSLTVSAG